MGLSNDDKIELVLSDLESWLDGGDDDGSMSYALNNDYKLHAASLWLSTGAISEGVENQIKGIEINYKKEMIEIKQICSEAFIYICSDCNHHAFLDEDFGDDINCKCCGEIAIINNTEYNEVV